MAQRREVRSVVSRLLREPMVGFILAAAALFIVSWSVESAGEPVIRIDPAELAWRVEQAEMARGGPLSEEARREVEAAYVDEQILVREALAMGLDDDPRIDDILAQKMLHVLSGDVIQPTTAELESYYTANLVRYTPAPTLAAEEIVVPLDASEPAELPRALEGGTPPGELPEGVLITHRVMASLTRADIADIFDPEMAAAAFDAEPGRWVGPHESVRGYHWLRVSERSAPGPLPLDDVREQVRLDWIADREEERLDARLAELRREYRIEIGREEEP